MTQRCSRTAGPTPSGRFPGGRELVPGVWTLPSSGRDPERMARTRRAGGWGLVVCCALLSACGSGGSSTVGDGSAGGAHASTSPTTQTASSSTAAEPVLECPNLHGGFCLGRLSGGRYTTQAFHPALTYTVPRGWQNMEDLDANVELLPPHVPLAGVDPGTSNYIGVYRDVALADGCATRPVPGLPRTPEAMMRHLRQRPDLRVSTPRHVRLGGLSGMLADLRQRPTWHRTCPYSGGEPLSNVLIGVADSGLDHAILPRQTMRLYLLQDHRVVLAIEVEDVRSEGKLPSYSRVVRTFHFATGDS